MIKKNDRIRLKITDMTVKGEGVGKYDGLAFFVKDAVIGDEVLAVVTKLKKGYGYAKTLEVLTQSPERICPACEVALRCGGCQLMQLSYEAQLRFRENLVRNAWKRIGGQNTGTVLPIIPMDTENYPAQNGQPLHFRNKLQFPVGWDNQGHVVTGFYAGRTHHIVSAANCAVSPEVNDYILGKIRGFLEKHRIAAYNEETGQGLVRHILIRSGFHTGQIMVCIVINAERLGPADLESSLAEELASLDLSGYRTAFPGENPGWAIRSICLNINKSRTNVILGDRIRCLYGEPYIEEKLTLGGENTQPLTFRIHPLSFFQTNPVQTERLYEKVLEFADLHGNETVWDLYCGTGTISLFLAQKAGKVLGVEIIPEAIVNAKDNAARNHIQNAEFFCGKSEEVFLEKNGIRTGTDGQKSCTLSEVPNDPAAKDPGEAAMIVVLDPPRKGCDAGLLEALIRVRPEKIVYVSCDPATLARDVEILGRGGYIPVTVQPVDMFPHTVHVETVCLLSQRKPDTTIEVDLDISELEVSSAETKATYEEIKSYVLEKYGLKVSNLYIAQVKRECGIVERINYNLPKTEGNRVPQCPEDKRKAIKDAFIHFQMI